MKRVIQESTRISASDQLSQEDMQAELDAHFAEVNAKIDAFMRKRPFAKFEYEYSYIEHRSMDAMIYDFVRYFNKNVREYGCGLRQIGNQMDV